MKALNTLRNLIIILVFAVAAANASASNGASEPRKADSKSAVAKPVTPQRKMAAPFVDPTLPLTELVERIRTEQASLR